MATSDKLLQSTPPDDPLRNETIIAEDIGFEQFLTLFSERHAEWIMGKVILVVSNNTRHQIILGLLFSLFNTFLGLKKIAGRILLAGIPMHITDKQPAREPDLMVVLGDKIEKIQETYLDGPADIVVEIVSPESSKRDRGDKFDEYEAAGVAEYWLLDPLRRESKVYTLDADGYYRPLPVDEQGRLTSRVLPGFAIEADLLWRENPPDGAELIELVQEMIS
jgi:Uma2 family endonuclease